MVYGVESSTEFCGWPFVVRPLKGALSFDFGPCKKQKNSQHPDIFRSDGLNFRPETCKGILPTTDSVKEPFKGTL